MEELKKFLYNYGVHYEERDGYLFCGDVDLRRFHLAELPDCFKYLACNRLYLGHNDFETVPSCIANIKVGFSIDFRYNPLKDGLRFFKDLYKGLNLNLDNTPLYIGLDRRTTIEDYRNVIDLEWALYNDPDYSGAKDCYDSGLFDFKVK